MIDTRPVRVWDLPTRLFHWVLTFNIVASVVSAKIGGNAMAWHVRFGLLVMTLLVFRLIWGLVGGRWSRFASFIYAPATLLRYLRGRALPGEHLDVGHNPLGSLSVFGLLALLTLQVATGLVADDEIVTTGPLNRFVSSANAALASGWHKTWGQWLIITLVMLHVAAIVYYLRRKRVNLVRPMWVGDKHLPHGTPASADGARQRVGAVAIVTLCAIAAYWVSTLGA